MSVLLRVLREIALQPGVELQQGVQHILHELLIVATLSGVALSTTRFVPGTLEIALPCSSNNELALVFATDALNLIGTARELQAPRLKLVTAPRAVLALTAVVVRAADAART